MKIPQCPPDFAAVFKQVSSESGRVERVISGVRSPCVDGKYRHWDRLRRLTPPDGLTHEEWWLGLKLARLMTYRPLPLSDVDGHRFVYALPDPAQELIYRVDSNASGRIELPEPVVNRDTRDRYVVSSLIEEAIASSQLEGAATTARVAKQMIRSGRRPTGRDERMILNNYRAMEFIRARTDEPLTPELVLGLHRIISEETLDIADAAGRFRRANELVEVIDNYGEVLHRPPPAEQLSERLEAMCAFANGAIPEGFLHPAVRAIVLHFWLAYDHPFVDGNGRTARALFYWSMLSQGYWLSEYITLSPLIKKAPARYARAFLYCETDENDLTYFILYHLRLFQRAVNQLYRYVETKARQQRRVEHAMRQSNVLNHRQLALVSHALRHPGFRYTFESHRTSHGVVYQTARADLLGLVEKGLLEAGKRGRTWVFTVPGDLDERLSALG